MYRSIPESKNCEILLLPTADRRFDTKVKCPTGQASFWVKFPTVRSLTRVKCPGIAREGKGGFGIDWYVSLFYGHANKARCCCCCFVGNCAGLLRFLQVLRIICIDYNCVKFISPVVQIYLTVLAIAIPLTENCVTLTRRVWNQTKQNAASSLINEFLWKNTPTLIQ